MDSGVGVSIGFLRQTAAGLVSWGFVLMVSCFRVKGSGGIGCRCCGRFLPGDNSDLRRQAATEVEMSLSLFLSFSLSLARALSLSLSVAL